MKISNLFNVKKPHLNYLVNWSTKNKYIYMMVPKTGCTTILHLLQLKELDNNIELLPNDIHYRKSSPLLTPYSNEDLFLQSLFSQDYFLFSFTRNPFTRILSAYLDKIAVNEINEITNRHKNLGINPKEYIPTFEEFLELISKQNPEDMDSHWAPQTFLLGLDIGQIEYDYIGKFEQFESALQILSNRIELPIDRVNIKFGKTHKTGADNKMKQYYSKQTIDMVRYIYQSDFKMLGYSLDFEALIQ